MKTIYLVLSETGSFPSRFIRFFTGDAYTHVSLSLNRELTEMYTFGRKYLYSVYPGGYIKERIHERIYKRFKNTRIAVLEIPVDEGTYVNIQSKVRNMYERKEEYRYSYLGVFLANFNKNKKRKNYYYCSEFIYELLKEFDILVDGESDAVIRPNDFLNAGVGTLIYNGLMREYQA